MSSPTLMSQTMNTERARHALLISGSAADADSFIRHALEAELLKPNFMTFTLACLSV
jgi:hypothetical protein